MKILLQFVEEYHSGYQKFSHSHSFLLLAIALRLNVLRHFKTRRSEAGCACVCRYYRSVYYYCSLVSLSSGMFLWFV